jgi:hypothetical protein
VSPALIAILADLYAAQQALRESSHAFDAAMAGLRVQLDSIAAANHAQGIAMEAILAANNKALALVEGRIN